MVISFATNGGKLKLSSNSLWQMAINLNPSSNWFSRLAESFHPCPIVYDKWRSNYTFITSAIKWWQMAYDKWWKIDRDKWLTINGGKSLPATTTHKTYPQNQEILSIKSFSRFMPPKVNLFHLFIFLNSVRSTWHGLHLVRYSIATENYFRQVNNFSHNILHKH